MSYPPHSTGKRLQLPCSPRFVSIVQKHLVGFRVASIPSIRYRPHTGRSGKLGNTTIPMKFTHHHHISNMNSPVKAKLSLLLLSLVLLQAAANGAVLVTTSGSGSNGNITITLPAITFNATRNYAGGFVALVFDEAQPNAGNDRFENIWTGPIFLGGTVSRYTDSGYIGGDITANDPYLVYTSTITISLGEVLTFPGGTISMTSAAPAVDVFPSGSYDVFLVDSSGVRFSGNGVTIIPEPSAAMLALAGLAGWVIKRRRD